MFWKIASCGMCCLSLLLAGCHDAPRTNPFDPALTPPVELQVVLDDTAGTATLSWGQYEGQQPFQEYRVLRHIAERTRVDTLAVIPQREQTTWVDTSLAPNTAYGYRLAVVNAGGYAAVSEERSVTGYAAGPVSLVAVEVDARQGQAQVRWSHYAGGRFQGYQVERRSGEEEGFGVVARLSGVQDTVYVDGGLEPEGVYFYRVVVEAGGQEWASVPSSRQGFVLEAVGLLAVTADPEEGVVRLRWGQFAGPGFQGYQVWRRVVGTDREEKVGEVAQVGDTTLVDGGARTGVEYEYRVVVQAAGQGLASNSRVARLELPRVVLAQVGFNSAKAAANLSWTQYRGPRFKAYRVVRRTTELVPQVVAEIADSTMTAYVDSGMVGNTEYFYRVVVVTERDEEVESEEVSGRFHALVQSWPLDLEEGEYVRLYWEEDRLTALVAGPGRVQLLFFDAQGALLGEQTLLENPFAGDPNFGSWGPPQAMATARLADGSRLLSFPGLSGDLLGLLNFGPDGQLQWREERLSEGDLPTIREERESYPGNWGLAAFNRLSVGFGGSVAVAFSAVEVEVDGEVQMQGTDFFNKEHWLPGGRYVWKFDKGWVAFSGLVREITLASSSVYSLYQGAWRHFVMRAQVVLIRSGASIFLSEGPYIGRLLLALDAETRTVLLRKGTGALLESPFPVLPGVPYRLRLEADEGAFAAYAAHPLYWNSETAEGTRFAGLAQIDGFVEVLAGDQPFILDPEAQAEEKLPLDRPVSEIRSWERENRGRRETWAGLCLPEQHQLRYARTGVNRTTGEFTWPFDSPNLIRRLGEGLGQEGGEMVFPLSFDVGPDGRFFVLDAGNGRIQVFGAEGEYLTQWGHKGSSEGEFDFGTGAIGVEGLAGSVAVDQEGYIYVADVGNKRIQKFAP